MTEKSCVNCEYCRFECRTIDEHRERNFRVCDLDGKTVDEPEITAETCMYYEQSEVKGK